VAGWRQIKLNDVVDLVDEQRIAGDLEDRRAIQLHLEGRPDAPDYGRGKRRAGP